MEIKDMHTHDLVDQGWPESRESGTLMAAVRKELLKRIEKYQAVLAAAEKYRRNQWPDGTGAMQERKDLDNAIAEAKQ